MSIIDVDLEKYSALKLNEPAKNLDEHETDSVDPRIQGELERLNKSSCDINKMETELDEAKALFTTSKNRQLQRLEFLQKKHGSCITKAKPFYESQQLIEKTRIEAQRAAQEYQRANSMYKTAKETLAVAEHNLASGEIPDVWQEHLSSTITKINMSKKTVDLAEENHKRKTAEYQNAEVRYQFLENDLKRNIEKSKLYYEEKSRWNVQMEAQKSRIDELEKALVQAKCQYKEAMSNLSKISEEIHLKRSLDKLNLKNLPPRESGVGAEDPNTNANEFS
jgi:chromosome segregation ATPase